MENDITKKDSINETIQKAENIKAVVFKRETLDRILLGKWTGVPIMLLLLAFIFWLTICGANYPSHFLSWLFAQIGTLLDSLLLALEIPEWLRSCLTDGIYRTLSWVVAVMLPPMSIFFPLFAILEECGYLPRVAFHLDTCFKKAGTCGKQGLTTCMALGCNAAGVTGCSMIESPRERLIAILTNSFTPCNGRLPMLIAIVIMFFCSRQYVFCSFCNAFSAYFQFFCHTDRFQPVIAHHFKRDALCLSSGASALSQTADWGYYCKIAS